MRARPTNLRIRTITRRTKIMGIVGAALCFAALAAFFLRGDPAPERDWSVAEAAWKEYSEKLIEEYAQAALPGSYIPRRISSTRFTSPQLERLLPDFRFYVAGISGLEYLLSEDKIFAVSLNGRIESLGGWTTEIADLPPDERDSPKLTSFIGSAGIVIKSAEDAADAGKIIEQIRYAHWIARDYPVGAAVVLDFPGVNRRFMAGQEGAEWVVSCAHSDPFTWPIEFRFNVDDKGVVHRVKVNREARDIPAGSSGDRPRPVS